MEVDLKFRRRKAQRPGEILEAAAAEFAEKGFAATRMDDIARRAGVVRGSLYRYFATKEDVFRAVIVQTMTPHVEALRSLTAVHPASLSDLLRGVVRPMATIAAAPPLGGVMKMVIGEARNFPELAQVWHDQLVAPTLEVLAKAVREAQARGEVRDGDPRAYALQILSPLFAVVTWSETFVPVGAPGFEIEEVLGQCVETFLGGVLTPLGEVRAPETYAPCRDRLEPAAPTS